MSEKKRLDVWLLENKGVSSRQKAQALILAGCVFVNEQKASSVAKKIGGDDRVVVKGKDHPYVSRGGVKLAHALKTFAIDVRDKVALDVGASTGGFTDCLLQNGTKKVYALDVGYGQLDWKLRQDPRVVVIERTNIREWNGSELKDKIDIVTVDVSFISLKKVVPAIENLLVADAVGQDPPHLIALIKPQFEAAREEVGSGGVVRNEAVQKRIVDELQEFLTDRDWIVQGVKPSPIQGPKGNQEYLLMASHEHRPQEGNDVSPDIELT
jgi:23S rRNA (cytidine1920-2'-O)/16S rRNA (cytidine1409-2'-O)-methyltransferase